MKKLIIFSIFIVLAALLIASPALAIPGKGAVKGEVTVVDPVAGTLTIKTKRGELVPVTVLGGFEKGEIVEGDWVLVKGSASEGGEIEAEWFKQVGKGRGKGNDEDKPEGKKDNSAYCAQGKKAKDHPLAAEVAGRFGVTEDMVMGYFCDGYGMGAIMLALKTRDLGVGADPEELLKDRALGNGWGQIWKDLDLIGSEKDGHSPLGLLNRPDHAGPKNQDD
jgi:hypothetical protein